MKPSPLKIILLILLCVGLFGALQAIWFSSGKNNFEKALEKTRQDLRQQGFKTDLAQFDFSITTEFRNREAALTFFSTTVHPSQPAEQVRLAQPVGDDSALVIWKQDWLKTESEPLDWAQLRESLAGISPLLDDACDAALAGPIRYDLDASKGSAMLLRHLGSMKQLSRSLGVRTVMELHDGNPGAAWTNLLAQARLVTAWEIEPVEISHLVLFGLTGMAFDTTWQALQFNRWPDEKLAALQREWQAVNFFTNLPMTAAFQRASAVQMCERTRKEPVMNGVSAAEFFKEAAHSPRDAWREGKFFWEQKRWQSDGVFDDERRLLLHYQQRELELRRAITAPDWSAMRALPGVTNLVLFTSRNMRMQSMFNMRLTGMAMQLGGSSLLGRAAEAETRRRIILTAIALERFRDQHGAYPKSLSELTENFLPMPPVDFMDGQPLRYQLADDERFTLYSVGLDGKDDGGKLPLQNEDEEFPVRRGRRGTAHAADIIWPRPATTNEVAAMRQQELEDLAATEDAQEESDAAQQWSAAAARQATVETILAAAPDEKIKATVFQGSLLSALLQNTNATGTNLMTLVDLLTLRTVITGDEPETVTFDVPIAHDVLTNLGSLILYVDPDKDNKNSDEDLYAGQTEMRRATNGNCLLRWSTIYESPGKHAVQLGLLLEESGGLPAPIPAGAIEVPPIFRNMMTDLTGPVAPFVISNLCQFSLGSAHYNTNTAAILHARLPEANARYTIELITTNGVRIRTLTGSTTNSEIREHWDLLDEHGRKFTDGWFNSVFHLTLPDSGRTQTLRGP